MPEDIKIPNNTEIDQALKEFEAKYGAEELHKAPEVLKGPEDSEIPRMVKLVMKFSGGAIKEQKQAEYVLLGFVVLAIGISLFLFFNAFRSPPSPPADQIIPIAGPGQGF